VNVVCALFDIFKNLIKTETHEGLIIKQNKDKSAKQCKVYNFRKITVQSRD
jgi:hypothetical protein